jgi:MHS family alpha-ketoglutarate permease-like MFS transporter
MAETGAASDLGPRAFTAAERLRGIIGGSAGNLVEWYDWFAYSAFSIYFAGQFFPAGDDTAQLFKTSLIFAVGFLARPLGAWMMGVYADRAGRKTALSVSVSLMCAGSLMIAVVPGYDAIGVAAPAILVLARLLQGLSVGGEYGASATYMSEVAGRARRGFWSSFQYVTLILGQLCALLVLIVLQGMFTDGELKAWAWRIPFFIGAGLAVIVFWMRRGLRESASFEAVRTQEPSRSRTMLLFLRHPRETLMIMGLTAGGSLAFYAYTTYMLKFLVGSAGLSKSEAAGVNAVALIAFMLFQPVAGWISDRVGRKTMLIVAFGGGVLAAYPVFSLIAGAGGNLVLVTALCILPLLINSGYSSISAVVKAELFPAHVRALGVALPYALANAVFGGTAEAVALHFKGAGHESGFYLYVAAILAVGLLVSLMMRDTRRTSLIHED